MIQFPGREVSGERDGGGIRQFGKEFPRFLIQCSRANLAKFPIEDFIWMLPDSAFSPFLRLISKKTRFQRDSSSFQS